MLMMRDAQWGWVAVESRIRRVNMNTKFSIFFFREHTSRTLSRPPPPRQLYSRMS